MLPKNCSFQVLKTFCFIIILPLVVAHCQVGLYATSKLHHNIYTKKTVCSVVHPEINIAQHLLQSFINMKQVSFGCLME
jgi:hypothetical protein